MFNVGRLEVYVRKHFSFVMHINIVQDLAK